MLLDYLVATDWVYFPQQVWEMELGEEFIPEVKTSWQRVLDYILISLGRGFHLAGSPEGRSKLEESVTRESIDRLTRGRH